MTIEKTSSKEFIEMTPLEVVKKIELEAVINTEMIDDLYLKGFLDCVDVLKTLFTEQEEGRKNDSRK